MQKTCIKCGETKALDDFYRRAANKTDGHDNKCKHCREAVSAAFDAKHPDRVAARIHRNPERQRQYDRRYAEANREKRTAKEKVKDALRAGRMVKHPCEVCGTSEGYIDAHHDDYSKPLSVRWLCRKHHKEHHAKMNLAVFR